MPKLKTIDKKINTSEIDVAFLMVFVQVTTLIQMSFRYELLRDKYMQISSQINEADALGNTLSSQVLAIEQRRGGLPDYVHPPTVSEELRVLKLKLSENAHSIAGMHREKFMLQQKMNVLLKQMYQMVDQISNGSMQVTHEDFSQKRPRMSARF